MPKPTESSRLMREAGESISEYLPELHTEIFLRVGCDGVPKRYIGKSIGYYPVLAEAQGVSAVRIKVVTRGI